MVVHLGIFSISSKPINLKKKNIDQPNGLINRTFAKLINVVVNNEWTNVVILFDDTN